jgi:ribose transport system substrate-binding protein
MATTWFGAKGLRSAALAALVLVLTACTTTATPTSAPAASTAAPPSTSSGGASPSAAAESPSAAAESPASSGQSLRLGLVLPDLTNQTINDIYLGAQARAKELPGVEIAEGGTSDTSQWLDACQRIVNSKIQVLAYDTLDAAATSTCIKQANEQNIKTICLFACTAEGKNDALITLDFEVVGKMGGEWVGKALTAQGGGEVAVLEGPPGDQAIQAVHKGFRDALAANCSNCPIVASVPGGHDRDTGYTAAQQVLTAHPNLKAIAGANDDVAMGIVRAVQQADKLGKVLITGNNGTCEALGSIAQNGLSETVLIAGQPFGISTVDTALKLLAGETVETVNVTPVQIDSTLAKGVLDGSQPDVTSVDLKARLTKAQGGCK